MQFRDCNQDEPCAIPPQARKGKCFYRREKKAEGALVNKEYMTFHGLRHCQEEKESFFFLLGSAMLLCLLVSQLYFTGFLFINFCKAREYLLSALLVGQFYISSELCVFYRGQAFPYPFPDAVDN